MKTIAMEIRNSPEFSKVFVADPQVLGVDAVKGSELVFPVVFKTRATQQYGAVREFRRRVRLALEEHHMLPGDPLRVFQRFGEEGDVVKRGEPAEVPNRPHAEEPAPAQDPTTIKPQETNPFSGE